VSKLGHLAAHCAFRQLALNVVKSRLPGANQAGNEGAAVLDVIQGPWRAETSWLTLSNDCDTASRPCLRQLRLAALIGEVTPLYGVLHWQ